jgi:hypothetical protein
MDMANAYRYSITDNRWCTTSISVNDGPVTVSKGTGHGDVVLYMGDEEVDRKTLGPRDTFRFAMSTNGKAFLMVQRR